MHHILRRKNAVKTSAYSEDTFLFLLLCLLLLLFFFLLLAPPLGGAIDLQVSLLGRSLSLF